MIEENVTKAILDGHHTDPFSVLGLQEVDGILTINACVPGADAIDVITRTTGRIIRSMTALYEGQGFFTCPFPNRKKRFPYRLSVHQDGRQWDMDDPYRFGPVLGEIDEHLLGEGSHRRLWDVLGAHVIKHEHVQGTHFAVWAPNASRVSLVGGFNNWDGRRHVMRKRGQTGVWEIFIPDLGEGEFYKYEILDGAGKLLPLKADPVGFGSEHPPETASVVRNLSGYRWHDNRWMDKRATKQTIDQPMSIYEVHLGSWRRVPEDGNRSLSYHESAEKLVSYAKDMGFTHIELMPVSEFPFEGSWGYQPVGLFAPTIRYGTPNELRDFVTACHQAEIGLILDWVPGHFPEDQHGLGKFDGTSLYEHADPKEGFHPDWSTLVFNYGRREVANYLIANAIYWLKAHHVDGLRVDAVASMLYRDYSRKEGEWVPNVDGGRENLEAIAFLKHMNEAVYAEMPGIMTAAEESTAFPGVSCPTSDGGLGFGYKWNMGWMNDTLEYMKLDPIHRRHHHHQMTFGLQYAFSENFILPISHDEVVHGKGSLLAKMPGSDTDQFANLRAYYGFMWGHPGKKLLFMGCEFAQRMEWNHDSSLDWHLLDNTSHCGVQSLIRDLNHFYRTTPALYQCDREPSGFQWVEMNNADESVFAWLRRGNDADSMVLVIANFTPVERSGWRVGVPVAGSWITRINTDAACYGGGNRGSSGVVDSEVIAASGLSDSIRLTLPPLSTLFLELVRGGEA